MSLPVQGAWIEMSMYAIVPTMKPSLPVQGAWIEIHLSTFSGVS